MNDEKIILSSKPIEIAEYQDYKLATFIISVLDEFDLNGRMIPKEVGEKYYDTIVGFPIVAKLIWDKDGNPVDFAGHEVYIQTNKNGEQEVRFGTQPIGSVIKAWIEEREVAGYDGEKSVIMIQAKLWNTRYPEYFKVLDDLWSKNDVASSWELSVSEYEMTIKGKILKTINFIGNCLLGSTVQGAVPSAGVVEYAELQNNQSEFNLATALSKDMIASLDKENKDKEGNLLNNKESENATEQENIEQNKTVTEETTINENTTKENAALTVWDLQIKIREKIREKMNEYCWIPYFFPTEKTVWVKTDSDETELDVTVFTYEVDENDEVTISEPIQMKLTTSPVNINAEIAQKDDALVKANEKIQELSTEISNLTPFKDAYEKAEQEKIEAETAQKRIDLLSKIEKSNLFTKEEIESSEIKQLIESVDETTIKNLMADKFMASLEIKTETKDIETSEQKNTTSTVKANLNTDETEVDHKSFIKALLG